MENKHGNKKITLRVEHGALLDCPVWESHPRGRNWWAEISIDPRAPGGLRRRFWARARGEYCYLVPQDIDPPVPVEVGADYYTGRGRKRPCRWYGVVVTATATHLTLKECPDARSAIRTAEELRRNQDLRRVVVVPAHEQTEGATA